MSLRDGPLGEIKPPVAWLVGAVLVAALLVALALFVTGGSRGGLLGGVQRTADGAMAPVGGILEAPVRASGAGSSAIGAYLMAGSQNRQLRADLAAAMSWRDQAMTLAQENARLRALLGVRTEPAMPMVAAETVLDARGPFSNSRVADAGADKGVAEGNPVLSEHGLVGRVAGVGPHACRIMLLTDIESRTPVMIARTNGRAILSGDGGPQPSLAYLRTHDPVREGDRVLTSGDGGVVPRGLPVGTVVRGFDGAWRVALDADAQPIDFVRILLYSSFSQLIAPGELNPGALPSTATDAPSEPPPAAVNGAKPATPPVSKPTAP